MPTYEYRCPECGSQFEKIQRMSDEPGAECPECGAAAERRMSAGAGFLFKGSGFYITDYRSDGYKQAAKSESGGSDSKSESGGSATKSDTKTESKSESKSDAKPATKSESKPAPSKSKTDS
jgi:putative FmdB family regulatory protein